MNNEKALKKRRNGASRLLAYVAIGALAVGAVNGIATPAAAQSGAVRFDIRAQPLANALMQISRQGQVDITAPIELTRGRTGRPVSGNMSVGAALTRVLEGSGLAFRPAGNGFVVTRPNSGEAPESGEAEAGNAAADSGSVDQEIVVTGTNLRGQRPVGSQLIVVDRAEIDREGYETAEEVVRDQSQDFGGGATNDLSITVPPGAANRGAGGNSYNGTSVNLRGLGSSSSLVLLDGQRLPLGGNGGLFTDISGIPIGAVERVEILPDGASALYGSDAVGGVVNYILRRNFNGGETRLRVGVPTRGGRQTYTGSQAFGLSWGSGNVLLTGQYQRLEQLRALDRDFSRSLDHRLQGGTDQRIRLFGPPGTITIAGVTYAIPQNPTGAPPRASDFVPNTNNLKDVSDELLFPGERSYSVGTFVSQDLTDWLSVRAQALYSNRENTSLSDVIGSFTLTRANPYYFNPTGGAQNISVSYNFTPESGPIEFRGTTEMFATSLGLTAELGPNWQLRTIGAFGGSWSESFNERLNAAALNARAASTDPARAFNPFGGPGANAALIDEILSATQNSHARSRTSSILTILDGTPFQLNDRDVRVAVGAEYRKLDFRFTNRITNAPFAADTFSVTAPTSREVTSFFGEILLPLLGAPGGDGLQRLDLSAAVRHERYSDFGSSTVPRVGFDFEPVRGFFIRGAYSRSFRAPDLTTLSDANNSASFVPITDSNGTTQTIFIGGSVNSELRPERGRTFSLGLEIAPPPIPRLRIGLNYFDIGYFDRLATVFSGVSLATILRNPIYDDLITYNPTPAQQQAACAFAFAPPVNCTTTPIGAIVDSRTRNVSTTSTTGVDFRVGYSFDLRDAETISLAISGTSIFTYREALSRTAPVVSKLDQSYNPISIVARGSINYRRGGFSAGASARYTGPSRYVVQLAGVTVQTPVSSLTTVDANLGYSWEGEAGLLSNLTLRLNVSNLFDSNPPFVNLQRGYDGANFDPLGRVVAFSLVKQW